MAQFRKMNDQDIRKTKGAPLGWRPQRGGLCRRKKNRGAYGLGREGPRRGFVQNNGTDGGDDSGGEASAVEKAWLKSGEARIGEGKG